MTTRRSLLRRALAALGVGMGVKVAPKAEWPALMSMEQLNKMAEPPYADWIKDDTLMRMPMKFWTDGRKPWIEGGES